MAKHRKIDGHYDLPGIEHLLVPQCITRSYHEQTFACWDVQPGADLPRLRFADQNYGGVEQSLREAIYYLEDCRNELVIATPPKEVEAVGKTFPTGYAGISLQSGFISSGMRRWCFVVSMPRGLKKSARRVRTRTVYIGNDNTYLANFDKKLAQAVELREGHVEIIRDEIRYDPEYA